MIGDNWRLPIKSQIETLLIFAFCVLCQDFLLYLQGRGGSQFYYEGFKTFGKMPGSSKAGTTMLIGEEGTSVLTKRTSYNIKWTQVIGEISNYDINNNQFCFW